jgi:hypothetical protein
VGIECADLASHLVTGADVQRFLPAIAHLVLILIVIATSFVGWSKTHAPGATGDVQSAFDRGFLVLLVDVIIVVEYFIIAKGVDFGATKGAPVDQVQPIPSAWVESVWLTIVFGTYLVWDSVARDRWNECWPSFVCTLLALGTAFMLAVEIDPARVILCDVSLLALVLLFRALQLDSTISWKPRLASALVLTWIVAGGLAYFLPVGLIA